MGPVYVLPWVYKCIPRDVGSVILSATWEFPVGLSFTNIITAIVLLSVEHQIMTLLAFLDHGDTMCLPGLMTPEMAALPLQAIQVSVANVRGSLLMLAP